ncbi:MAG: hypothetical protein IJ147_09200 [Lachnospiraceae bacterium]|nr:hypothetical protein [Lachnospiraceae bacterium]
MEITVVPKGWEPSEAVVCTEPSAVVAVDDAEDAEEVCDAFDKAAAQPVKVNTEHVPIVSNRAFVCVICFLFSFIVSAVLIVFIIKISSFLMGIGMIYLFAKAIICREP